ncbi:hypothetical protein Baya_15527 [Bagarius yarrelli]|uniref:Uncharacterized protein n=1 Tax=Bagarius yarrelli TaxID=175774 RepID=A0A556VCA7_BAGYA|nr:hypothetical protein Baya_15527 [Bagarius yarrelli]
MTSHSSHTHSDPRVVKHRHLLEELRAPELCNSDTDTPRSDDIKALRNIKVMEECKGKTSLKRSFDIDDVDEIPTFSPASTVTTPISPSSLLNKANEVRSPGGLVSPHISFEDQS